MSKTVNVSIEIHLSGFITSIYDHNPYRNVTFLFSSTKSLDTEQPYTTYSTVLSVTLRVTDRIDVSIPVLNSHLGLDVMPEDPCRRLVTPTA